jgi:threonine dehydrogenase-like Zn-dependent dehydrogenase
MDRIVAGEVDPTFIITHTVPLEEAPTAFETFKHKQDECVKVVLKP